MVRPWYATSSDKPHGGHQTGSDSKFTHAGKVVYKLLAERQDASSGKDEILNMSDLQLVRPEEIGEVPVTRMHAFITHTEAGNCLDAKEAEPHANEGSIPSDSSASGNHSAVLSESEQSSSASESGGDSSESDDDHSEESNESSSSDNSDESNDSSLPVGTNVVLTNDYKDFADASGGPLKPGSLSHLVFPRTLAIEGRARHPNAHVHT